MAGQEISIHVHIHNEGDEKMSELSDQIARLREAAAAEKAQRDTENATMLAKIAELQAKVDAGTVTQEDRDALDQLEDEIQGIVPDSTPDPDPETPPEV